MNKAKKNKFIAYVNVGNLRSEKIKEYMEKVADSVWGLEFFDKDSDKVLFFPIRIGESRIEKLDF